MTDIHEPDTDLTLIAEQAFLEATEKHIATEDNRDDIHVTFNDLITKAMGTGEIVVAGKTIKKLISDYVWQKVNSSSGRRTQKYLAELRDGQLTAFEINSSLDVVLTAGKDRRTTLRNLGRSDVERMLQERHDNYSKQGKALAQFEELAEFYYSILAKYGSIPNAVKAGAFAVAKPSDEATA
jgi:hypothetical protein